MTLDKDFHTHLHELIVEASLNLREESAAYERKLVWEAQQTRNQAAIPLAYSRAAIHKFRTRVELVTEKYIAALTECGIEISDSVEREILSLIGALTSACHPLHFPPALKSLETSAIQRSYAMEHARTGSLLYKQAANRLRGLKLRDRQKSIVETSEKTTMSVQDSSSTTRCPKAFLSYSWESDAHNEWVKSLATRLRADGIDVSIDRWSAIPGDQLPAFMERAIRENEFVVIVCTPRYKSKSEARQGGVGYEGDIMTAEVMASGNHRKFIPILRSGTWAQAAPSWLAGKYHINLSSDPYLETAYGDLARTLLGVREQAPPIGTPLSTVGNTETPIRTPQPTANYDFDDIKITRVIIEEVTEPRNDGTPGCALYAIPFALSRRPPAEWGAAFIENWNHPPRFTSMHRPGIASLRGAVVTLNGTTIEEVEKYHRETLQLAVSESNKQYRDWKTARDKKLARENAERAEHLAKIADAGSRIKFD
ncbi:toll/interleukin-1 receptor domain-containing protein [Granulicella paludicola]|uniref:toll/interleukin-1 receptor domain-containing protein n=1 Tax=Granulicella paludicola TaxID=474951 RepID=UPI0021E0AE2B|nr:toll/interleukin-1 receptor domain-containing protein [Granulicella paludicola]